MISFLAFLVVQLYFLLRLSTEIRLFESLNNQESNLESGYYNYIVHNSSTALTFSMFFVLAFDFLFPLRFEFHQSTYLFEIFYNIRYFFPQTATERKFATIQVEQFIGDPCLFSLRDNSTRQRFFRNVDNISRSIFEI